MRFLIAFAVAVAVVVVVVLVRLAMDLPGVSYGLTGPGFLGAVAFFTTWFAFKYRQERE